MSLSRLQILAWSFLILSAIFTAALTNVASGWQSPLNIEVPSELWVVMGISTASVVASPAILRNKAKKEPKKKPNEDTKKESNEETKKEPNEPKDKTEPTPTWDGLLACNHGLHGARWADLMMGEEVGNYKNVDVGKMQMFFFTFILIIGYGAAMAAMFREPGVVTGLPEVQEGMNVLLGISHTGYLANKTVSHTAEKDPEQATT